MAFTGVLKFQSSSQYSSQSQQCCEGDSQYFLRSPTLSDYFPDSLRIIPRALNIIDITFTFMFHSFFVCFSFFFFFSIFMEWSFFSFSINFTVLSVGMVKSTSWQDLILQLNNRMSSLWGLKRSVLSENAGEVCVFQNRYYFVYSFAYMLKIQPLAEFTVGHTLHPVVYDVIFLISDFALLYYCLVLSEYSGCKHFLLQSFHCHFLFISLMVLSQCSN